MDESPQDQQSQITNHKLTPPDRGHLLTEQRLPASAQLDTLSIEETLTLINDQDATITAVLRAAIGDIAPLVERAAAGMRGGGRLIYVGAGTSGRLGVLDASEIPPTFHCEPGQVVGIIAGGDSALRNSSEGMEDDPNGARAELTTLNVGKHDVVVGIAAGGTTPYVVGALRMAKERGAGTGLICCIEMPVQSRTLRARTGDTVAGSDKASAYATVEAVDHMISLPVGPEVVTGSTRMKAGTATKMALNMISTAVMVRLGKTWGNLMIDMHATNAKLRDRTVRIITGQCDLTRDEALALLDRAEGSVKTALVMAKRGVDAQAARTLLQEHGQQLRAVIGEPR